MAAWLLQAPGRRFGAVLLLCAACSNTPADELVAVGQAGISRVDVAYRTGIAHAYGSRVMDEVTALVSLLNDRIEQEVGRKAGVVVTEKELVGFSQHVDQSSKAPELLKQVKQVFGDDVAAYRHIYLVPKIMNRKLRGWFSRDASMQAKPRAAIEQAYALVQSRQSFEKAARKTGLTYAEQSYDTGQKAAPDALKPYFPAGMAAITAGFRKVLEQLKAGEIAQTIIEDDTAYRVVRLLEKEGGKASTTYRTAEITASKQAFDAWFRKQAGRVPVTIRDARLQSSLCSRYRQLYWLARICVP